MNYKSMFGALAAMASISLYSCQQPSSSVTSAEVAVEAVSDGGLLQIVEDLPTTQAFLKDPVPEADIQRIVNAGINAPSAMNRQPWHFTVVSNAETIQQMGEAAKVAMKNIQMPPKNAPKAGGEEKPKPPTSKGPRSAVGDSPVIIVISCNEGSEFDAGLACESMNDMANLLGYGTKIASSATIFLNGENKADYYEKFQIPEGQRIVTVLLVGKINTEGYDAVTSATPRKPQEQVVSFVK
ncbi:MAG: nitroreductase family protein [Parabacteroides sp.]